MLNTVMQCCSFSGRCWKGLRLHLKFTMNLEYICTAVFHSIALAQVFCPTLATTVETPNENMFRTLPRAAARALKGLPLDCATMNQNVKAAKVGSKICRCWSYSMRRHISGPPQL